MSPGSGPQVARSRRLGPAFDLLAAYAAPSGFFFERAGAGCASSGIARRIAVPAGPGRIALAGEAASAALASVAAGDGGPGPVAVGAFAFDDGEPAALAIPHRTVLRRDAGGPTWEVLVEPADEPGARATLPRGAAGPHAGEITTSAVPEPEAYAAAVREAVRRIVSGDLRKVVLAREVDVRAGRILDPRALLRRLRAVDPGCFCFAATRLGAGPVLVGATPELLVRREGLEVGANPLAGSAARGGTAESDRASGEALLASEKDRGEHALVVEGVVAALEPFCEEIEADAEPSLAGTANVWHLASRVRGRLREPAAGVLELVGALHPTPAVCGTPTEAARAVLADLEAIERGLYAGPVGWVDAAGDGEWAVALRCAELSGERARLFAGAGIVAGSDPEAELDETERKFRALLDSLRWG